MTGTKRSEFRPWLQRRYIVAETNSIVVVASAEGRLYKPMLSRKNTILFSFTSKGHRTFSVRSQTEREALFSSQPVSDTFLYSEMYRFELEFILAYLLSQADFYYSILVLLDKYLIRFQRVEPLFLFCIVLIFS